MNQPVASVNLKISNSQKWLSVMAFAAMAVLSILSDAGVLSPDLVNKTSLVAMAYLAGAYPWMAAERDGGGDKRGVHAAAVALWFMAAGFGWMVGTALALM